jgi:large subunit ribosomal protein L18
MESKKITGRQARHKRIRKRISGTSERPRLSVFRSHKNIYAQVIDDTSGNALVHVSTMDKTIKKNCPYGGNTKAAAALGELLAMRAKEKTITKVVFDRCGYLYHGRIKALAEGARKAGLEF